MRELYYIECGEGFVCAKLRLAELMGDNYVSWGWFAISLIICLLIMTTDKGGKHV